MPWRATTYVVVHPSWRSPDLWWGTFHFCYLSYHWRACGGAGVWRPELGVGQASGSGGPSRKDGAHLEEAISDRSAATLMAPFASPPQESSDVSADGDIAEIPDPEAETHANVGASTSLANFNRTNNTHSTRTRYRSQRRGIHSTSCQWIFLDATLVSHGGRDDAAGSFKC